MVKEVEEHSHCVICGEVTSSGEKFCSEECKDQFMDQQKSAERRRKISILLIFAFAASIIVISLIFG